MTHHVIFSGGLDSTTLLAHIINIHDAHNVRAISFDYGQRHRRELEAAAIIANRLNVKHSIITVPDIFQPSSLTSDIPVPTGSYEPKGMDATVVQGRNLLFTALAVAQAARGDHIHLGVHAGDHALYGDCQPQFWDPFTKATAHAYDVQLNTPYLHLTKTEITRLGDLHDAPLHLTYSCYNGQPEHCGTCATCIERHQAFRETGTVDPTAYTSPVITK